MYLTFFFIQSLPRCYGFLYELAPLQSNRLRRSRLSVNQQTDLFRGLTAKGFVSAASAYTGRNMIEPDIFPVNLKDLVDQFLTTLRGSTYSTCEHAYPRCV